MSELKVGCVATYTSKDGVKHYSREVYLGAGADPGEMRAEAQSRRVPGLCTVPQGSEHWLQILINLIHRLQRPRQEKKQNGISFQIRRGKPFTQESKHAYHLRWQDETDLHTAGSERSSEPRHVAIPNNGP